MQIDFITKRLESHFDGADVFVDGDGTHFTALIVSPLFENKTRIARQQLVYAAFNAELSDGSLHALSLKTYTPTEWEQLNHDTQD